MNIQELGRKMYLMSFCIVLVLLVLAGCETTKVVTFEPVSAEVVIKETPTNEEGVVDPESNEGRFEPSPVPEFLVYSNQLYGFEFEYPDTWTLLEEDHGVLLMKGRNRLGIRHRWVDEELPPIRTGIPAGDLVYRGKIQFMGTVIPAEFLQFECKNKIVFYGGTGDIEIDDLVFSITLEDRETYDYREIELSEDLLDEAKSIVKSFKRIDKSEVSTQAPLAIETGLTAHLELPERFTIGEKIILKFVLKNISETPLYVLSWYTPLEGIREDIFRVTFDGQPLSYKGLCAERISPTADAYVLLYPGEPVSAVVELSESYDFSQAGTYRIEFISPRFSHIARTKGEMVQTREELGPVNIPSNEVSVDLVGSPLGEGLPRLRTPEEAQEMIVAYLRHENRGVGPIIPVEELHIEGLWADLGAQLFRVRKGKILKNFPHPGSQRHPAWRCTGRSGSHLPWSLPISIRMSRQNCISPTALEPKIPIPGLACMSQLTTKKGSTNQP